MGLVGFGCGWVWVSGVLDIVILGMWGFGILIFSTRAPGKKAAHND